MQIYSRSLYIMNCTHCGDRFLVLDEVNGDYICTYCGTVSNEQIYKYDNVDRNEVPPPPSAFSSKSVIRLNKYVNLNDTINVDLDRLDLPKHISTQVLELFEKFKMKKISRGRVRIGIIACCIFYICKKENIQRSIAEISNLLNIQTVYIHKAKKLFDGFLKDDTLENRNTLESEQFLKRFCNTLTISKQDKYKIIQKSKKIMEHKLDVFSNRKATSICATLIIFVGNNLNFKINKIEFCKNVNVSIVTVNKLLRQLKTYNIQII